MKKLIIFSFYLVAPVYTFASSTIVYTPVIPGTPVAAPLDENIGILFIAGVVVYLWKALSKERHIL